MQQRIAGLLELLCRRNDRDSVGHIKLDTDPFCGPLVGSEACLSGLGERPATCSRLLRGVLVADTDQDYPQALIPRRAVEIGEVPLLCCHAPSTHSRGARDYPAGQPRLGRLRPGLARPQGAARSLP
jgi:hypothetical protein